MPSVLSWSLPPGPASFLDQRRLQAAGIWHELVWRRRREGDPARSITVDDDPLVSLLCVSKRPQQLAHVADIWRRQRGCRVELILVTNIDGYMPKANDLLGGVDGVVLIQADPAQSLGEALNLGVAECSGQIIAKIDDDDDYAPNYACDLAASMRQTGAGVVGKKTYFVYLAAGNRTVKMYPGNENRRVGRVAGGTIGFHRDVAAHVKFADRTLGEDVSFVRAAERAGFAIYSTTPNGYLQIRQAELGHTWSISDDQLAASAEAVAIGRSDSLWH